MNCQISKYSIFNWIVFLVWPFAGFVLSLKRIGRKSSFWIFIAYFFLIGCSFILQNQDYDSYRYAENFIESRLYLKYSFNNLFYGQEGTTDIYVNICNYLVGLFTDNPRLLFGLYGSVFGLFLYKNISILNKTIHSNPFVFFYVVLGVFMLNPHYNINGVRFWTASYFFIFIVLKYFLEEPTKKRLFLLLTLVIFVHGAFIIPSLLLLAYIYLKSKLSCRRCLVLALMSLFFIGLKEVGVIESLFSLLESNNIRFSAYLDLNYIKERTEAMENISFLNVFFRFLPLIYIPIYICFFLTNSRKCSQDKVDLLSFSMLLFSVVNVFSFIPSFGRFYVITYSLLLITLLFYYEEFKSLLFYKFLILFSVPCLSFVFYYYIYSIKEEIISPIYINGTIFSILDFVFKFKFV